MLVVGYRLITHTYFLDELQPYELDLLVQSIPFADRNAWEQTRLKIYTTASMFSKRKLTIKDVMSFPWEKETDEQPETEITTDELTTLQQYSKTIENSLNTADGNRL